MRQTTISAGALALLLVSGCVDDRGASDEGAVTGGILDEGGEGDGPDSGDDGDNFDVGDGGGDGDGDGDGSQCACAPKSDLIYVLSYENFGPGSIWTFNPANYQFSKVVDLASCGVAEMPFSMGVSRDGRAFVQVIPSGDILTVDVNSGQCADPGFSPNAELGSFGMAFVSRSQTDPCDKLYGMRGAWDQSPYACPGQGCGRLGKADPNGLQFSMVGNVDYFGGELSGTGDGRLFAFVHGNPARLIELDKDDGEEIGSLALNGVSVTDAFAFAFWGGDFYLFTEANDTQPLYPEAPSKVIKVDWDESDGNGKAVTTIIGSAPILVAGAGVSTCAPFVPQG